MSSCGRIDFELLEPNDGETDTNADTDTDADADTDTDADTDSDIDSDTDTDTDTDVDTNSDTLDTKSTDSDGDTDFEIDSEAETDTDFTCIGSGVWLDELSGLCWAQAASGASMNFDAATIYCSGLATDGYNDWRVPDIDELRSLVRGCADVEWDISTDTGGACPVHDGCDSSCRDNTTCGGCGGAADCYWDPALSGICGYTWSSSSYLKGNESAWYIGFTLAYLNSCNKSVSNYVRCVRG